MQNVIKVQHGFHSHQIGSITVFTGKIRVKESMEFLQHNLQNWADHIRFYEWKGCTTMQYCVTDFTLNCRLKDAINEELRRTMVNRINAKYDQKQKANPINRVIVMIDDLPF